MTAKTPTQLKAEVATSFPDNTTGLITPAIMRTFQGDIIDSYSAGQTINITQFGAALDGVNDDSAAWTTAINYACTHWPTSIVFPAGVSICNSAWPAITRPISIVGQGRRVSIVQFSNSVTGNCITLQNVGFNNETTDLPRTGNTAWTALSAVKAGAVLKDFSVEGTRTAAQNGIVIQGDVDHLTLDLDINYFNGNGVYIGENSGTFRGILRESYVRCRLRHCGKTDGTAAFLIYQTDNVANPSSDSTNLNHFELQVIMPYGMGVQINDARTTSSGNPIYRNRFDLLLHGRFIADTPNVGKLLSITGAVSNNDFDVYFAYSAINDYVFELLTNTSVATLTPLDNCFNFRMPSTIKGGIIGTSINKVGDNNEIRLLSYHGSGEALVFATANPGISTVYCEEQTCFQATTADMTLSGTNAIAIAGWTIAGTTGLSDFFPAYNTNGTGDTMLCTLFGINGTITRSGSIGGGTDTYTFTPAAASSAFIPAGTYFSKIQVDLVQGNTVSGRYSYSPMNKYGLAVSSSYLSGRLLEMFPWQFHIENANSIVRYSYGPPAADTSGNPLATWRSGFVGVTATPTVAGLSKLVGNYAAPTTITNFTDGIDGQTIYVVAVGTNCTIANNANILTTTGANITMTNGQVLAFTFDTNLALWCGS